MTSPALFVLAIVVLLFTPGPTNTLLWASGASVGVRRSLPLLLAELAGYLASILLVLLIYESILQRAPYVERVLAVAAGIYVCFLALKMWVRSAELAAGAELTRFRKVLIVTLLNPKSFVLALTIIPTGHPYLHWYFVALSACIILIGLSWIVLGHVVGSAVGRDRLALFNRFSSLMLTGFAGYIIVSALH